MNFLILISKNGRNEKSSKDAARADNAPFANTKPSVVSNFGSTSGRKRWGGGVNVKDSTDEFEALLDEIEPSYKTKVSLKFQTSFFCQESVVCSCDILLLFLREV